MRVERSAVTRHQHQGALPLLAEVYSSCHNSLLVEHGEVHCEGDIGKEEEEGGAGRGRRLELLGQVLCS